MVTSYCQDLGRGGDFLGGGFGLVYRNVLCTVCARRKKEWGFTVWIYRMTVCYTVWDIPDVRGFVTVLPCG